MYPSLVFSNTTQADFSKQWSPSIRAGGFHVVHQSDQGQTHSWVYTWNVRCSLFLMIEKQQEPKRRMTAPECVLLISEISWSCVFIM